MDRQAARRIDVCRENLDGPFAVNRGDRLGSWLLVITRTMLGRCGRLEDGSWNTSPIKDSISCQFPQREVPDFQPSKSRALFLREQAQEQLAFPSLSVPVVKRLSVQNTGKKPGSMDGQYPTYAETSGCPTLNVNAN
jgi:hypothetical protein